MVVREYDSTSGFKGEKDAHSDDIPFSRVGTGIRVSRDDRNNNSQLELSRLG
jgi:hypothetical protein